MPEQQTPRKSLPSSQPGEFERMLAKLYLPILVYLLAQLLMGVYLMTRDVSSFEGASATAVKIDNFMLLLFGQFIPGILLLRFALAARRATSMPANEIPSVLKKLLPYWWFFAVLAILGVGMLVVVYGAYFAAWS